MKVTARKSVTTVLDVGTQNWIIFQFLQNDKNYVLSPVLEGEITFLPKTDKGVCLINLAGTHWGTSEENQELLKDFINNPNKKEIVFL